MPGEAAVQGRRAGRGWEVTAAGELAVLAAAAACVSVIAAGCGGGGSHSPGIASVASSTTAATTTQSAPGSGGGGFGGSAGGRQGGQFSMAMKVGNAAQGAEFSACMRKHGVTNFPDPNGQGVIEIHSGMGIDPGSPTFNAARTACDKLLPNGGQPTPAEQAQRQQQMLAFSKCMRAHGIKDFPDPNGGGIQLHVTPGSDLNPNNQQFQKAQNACQGLIPFKNGSAKAGGGGG
jgi:hypothetical protein